MTAAEDGRRDPRAGTGPPLRLALCTDTYAPHVNGVARTLGRLADAVRDRGGDVRVLTTSHAGARADAAVERFASIPFWAYPELQLALPSPLSLERTLRQWGATLVHAATPFGVGLAARSAATRAGVPLVTSYHTSFSAYARYYHLSALAAPGWGFLRWFHNGGRRTYCPTHAVRRELYHHGFERIAIWDRGVDSELFSPVHRSRELRLRLGAGDDTAVVAYVGRLALEKGLDRAMAGMRRVIATAGRPTVLVLAGQGPYERECREAAPPGTIFLGELAGSALSALYASADIFLFPSTTDTFGNVLLEAMASGLAVVAADAPPTREIVSRADAGLLFNGRSADALADAVLAVRDDVGVRRRLATTGIAAARQRSWAAVFDELCADYGRVIREARMSLVA